MGHLTRYESYQRTGVAWMGRKPFHWRIKKLKFVADLVGEKVEAEASNLSYMGLEHIEPWTGNRIEDINASSEGVGSAFEPGDVLFGKLRPYLAKVYLAQHRGLISTEALVLRSKKDELLPRFLRYFLVSKDCINIIDGSVIPPQNQSAEK